MRKGAARLLVLIIIAAAAYILNSKPDWLSAVTAPVKLVFMADYGGETVRKLGNSDDTFAQLEAELAHTFQTRADRVSLTYYGDKKELSDRMGSVIKAALRQDDYSAYILESYLYTIRSWGNKSTIALEAKYRETKEQTAAVERKTAEVLAEIIKPGMNDHEKVMAIHDWIVRHVEYDQSLSYYTAYHAITLGKAVCQGYSLLAYKMLNEAGITALIAEGTVHTGEHAWNMVLLDGNWYHLDVTWDDPVGAVDSKIRYTYYLKTDEELRADHQWTRTYPAADKRYIDVLRGLEQQGSNEDKARFNKLKMLLGLHWFDPEYTISDQEQLSKAVQSAIRSRTNSLQFRYASGDLFPEALKAAFEGARVSVGYKASYEPFDRGGSLLVNIQLEYK